MVPADTIINEQTPSLHKSCTQSHVEADPAAAPSGPLPTGLLEWHKETSGLAGPCQAWACSLRLHTKSIQRQLFLIKLTLEGVQILSTWSLKPNAFYHILMWVPCNPTHNICYGKFRIRHSTLMKHGCPTVRSHGLAMFVSMTPNGWCSPTHRKVRDTAQPAKSAYWEVWDRLCGLGHRFTQWTKKLDNDL